jgi:hypothetical protein
MKSANETEPRLLSSSSGWIATRAFNISTHQRDHGEDTNYMADCDVVHTTAASTIRNTITLSNLLLDFVTYNIWELDMICNRNFKVTS